MNRHHAIDPLSPTVRSLLRWTHSRWSLVVGAGITIGILPSWRGLARQILEITTGERVVESHFAQLVTQTGWHFDAWIQTALNAWVMRGNSEATFAEELERILYGELRGAAAANGLEPDLVCAFYDAVLLKKRRRLALIEFLSSTYPNNTARQLASVLSELAKVERSPTAVLTFNYDTILELFIRLEEMATDATTPPSFYRITRPAAPYLRDRIPIFHIHGCLLPRPAAHDKKIVRLDSRDRLVAPEASYNEIAGSVFDWAQNTFLHFAHSSNLLVVGHSLSDPNLRRWLAWTAAVRERQLPKPMSHIWLRVRPDSNADAQMIEHSVRHLGMTVGWLESWSDVAPALRNLAGLVPGQTTA